jgi:formate transporter
MASSEEKKNKKSVLPEDVPPRGLDAYDPSEVADRVLHIGVKKTRYPAYKTLVLGLMGGCFISLGALYEIYILSHPSVGAGTAVILAPLFYAIGYIIAFISGAEVFTTNNLSVMGLASGQLGLWEVTRNWSIVLIANLLGTMLVVAMYYLSGLFVLFDFAIIETAKILSANKIAFSPLQTIVLGVFGNLLICSGLWLAMAGKSVTDQFVALLLPVAAVPALNFQHCTGNMFQFFLALVTGADTVSLDLPSVITFWSVAGNLFFVAIGNIIGGGVFIALVYYFVFIRGSQSKN